jgi:diadenosine tetraphosphate (Ap4A) HIT family hydrolase
MIKVNMSEVIKSNSSTPAKGKQEMLEQKFKVTEKTSFIEMRDEACLFWDLYDQREKFCLVLPNMHDIMSLNKEPSHIAHTLAKYFEIHRAKRAVLHLIRPDMLRNEIQTEEK